MRFGAAPPQSNGVAEEESAPSPEPLSSDAVRLYKSDDHMRNFLDCVRSREKPICDIEVGFRSVTVCHLGNIAQYTGHKLRTDPKNGHIIGDTDAAAYWSRQYAPGWTPTA